MARDRWKRPVYNTLRPLLHLFGYYPLFLLVLVPLYLLDYGVLMDEYDAFHLIWNANWFFSLLNGIAIASILGLVLLSVYALDRARRMNGRSFTELMALARKHPAGVVPPTWAYWAAWVLMIVGAALPGLFFGSKFQARYPIPDGTETTAAMVAEVKAESDPFHVARWALPAGMILCFGIFGGLTLGKDRSRWVAKAHPRRPVITGFRIIFAIYLILFSLYSFELLDESSPFRNLSPASLSVFYLFGFATELISFLYLVGGAWWLRPLALVVVAVLLLIPACQTHHRLPGMQVNDTDLTYYEAGLRPRLSDYDTIRTTNPAELLDDQATLDAWNARMIQRYGTPRPLVIVAVSGGASASALYAAEILFSLELKHPGFSDQVRIITGASGGMLGAAYFIAHFLPETPGGLAADRDAFATASKARYLKPNAETERLFEAAERKYRDRVYEVREKAREQLGEDFLAPLIQHTVHKDLPLLLVPVSTTNDRGRALEASWTHYLDGAIDRPFKQLKQHEKTGALPSMILTPMIIEDGRQLIISNLDLDHLVDSSPPGETPEEPPSHTAMEFYRLFPNADRFRLSTAVRLSATFPILSPVPALPTAPERHVADAGYSDNYGTLTATRWMQRNLEWFDKWSKSVVESAKGRTRPAPKVYLLQLRCFAFEADSRTFETSNERQSGRNLEAGGFVRTEKGGYTLRAPLEGLFASWRAHMVYRGDERVDFLQRETSQRTNGRLAMERVLYELPFAPSLNWSLTKTTRGWMKVYGGMKQVGEEFEEAVKERGAERANPASIRKPAPRPRSPAEGRREFYRDLLDYESLRDTP